MNPARILTITTCVLLFTGCQSYEPSEPARRYLDFFEIARLSDFTDPKTDLVTTEFRVLERPEAQADMGLSQEQIIALQKAYKASSNQILGLTEYIAQRKAAKQRSRPTEKERISQNMESSREIGRIMARFHAQELKRILTPQQLNRLNQLVLQVRGPVLLLIDTELASALGIDSDRMQQIREVAGQADQEIIPMLQKFGRDFISGYGCNETEQDRLREMNDLIIQLRRMMRDRDNSILRVLTLEQRDRFKTRQGKPLPIQWDPWEFMREPFEKKDS